MIETIDKEILAAYKAIPDFIEKNLAIHNMEYVKIILTNLVFNVNSVKTLRDSNDLSFEVNIYDGVANIL